MLRRNFTPVWLTLVALGATACGSDVTQPTLDRTHSQVTAAIGTTVSADVSDGHGTAWRQLTETTGLTWNQVAQLCPRDGINPCWGSISTIDLSGWVWATDEQTVQLIAKYEPGILASRSISGAQYANGIAAFFGAFQPTTVGGCSGFSYVVTCSFGSHVSGWTATSDSYGSAVSGTIQSGFNTLPFIRVVPDASVAVPSALRGLFLWRADGTGGTAIVANNDSGSVDAPYAGVAVANVLANDLLAGGPASVDNVTLSQLSTTHAGITLNTTDGAVRAAAGTRVGVDTLRYRICETARPANCASASVTVTIAGNRVDANDDNGASKTGGGIAVTNVLANDTFAGAQATLLNVTLNTTLPDASLVLQSDGAVSVVAGATTGVHRLSYEICERASPTNCDQAIASVTVSAYSIDAVNDQGSAPSAPGGTAVSSVLSNDTFDNSTATLANVQLSLVSSAAGVSLDVSDGSVDVAPGTPGGTVYLVYRICEIASPANCDQASVTVTITPQAYVISNDRPRVSEGYAGSFTVTLLQAPSGTVTTALSYLAGTMPISTTTASLSFTPANWNTPQTVAFLTTRDSDKDDNAGTFQLTSPGIATRYIVVSGLDTDRKRTNPVTMIQAPYNGETVSGLVNFWGTATDSDGYTVDGKFYVDGVRIATVASSVGTFRAPAWSSTTVANGWHTLELRVTDNGGNDGRMLIKVFVRN